MLSFYLLHGPKFFLLFRNSCNSSHYKPNINLLIFTDITTAGELCGSERPHYVTKNLPVWRRPSTFCDYFVRRIFFIHSFIHSFIHQYSALEAGSAGTRAQSCDRHGSGTLHPGQVLGGSLPLRSPAFRRTHFRRQEPVRPQRRERS